MMKFRDSGAQGALLDEYEKSIEELRVKIDDVTSSELCQIVDTETKDEDCRSIQTILSHVVNAGYGYAINIRNHLGENSAYRKNVQLSSIKEYQKELDVMMQFNIMMFNDYPDMVLEEHDISKKIITSSGQYYDPEQILEHAIVHVLRHRRQIERFLLKLR